MTLTAAYRPVAQPLVGEPGYKAELRRLQQGLQPPDPGCSLADTQREQPEGIIFKLPSSSSLML
jgi:hypothetical protein